METSRNFFFFFFSFRFIELGSHVAWSGLRLTVQSTEEEGFDALILWFLSGMASQAYGFV